MNFFSSLINNIVKLPFEYIGLLWLTMLLFIFLLIYFKKKPKASNEELKKSKILFRLYLDQYFITNKWVTFSLSFIYIFGISLIFILIRYMYLGQVNSLRLTQSNVSMLFVMFIYFKLFATIILYKILLDNLFKHEINKLYLYVMSFSWFHNFYELINFKIGEHILGCIRVPCYRISTLTYKEDLYVVGDLPEYIHRNEHDYYISNKRFIALVLKVQDLAKQNDLIRQLFVGLAYILRFLNIHISDLNKQLPYLILFIIFLYELSNKEFRYIYMASFIFLLIKTKNNLGSFINKRFIGYDSTLRNYFYRNEVNYTTQRISFFQKDDITTAKLIYSQQNMALDIHQKTIVDYIENHFIFSLYDPQRERRKIGFYRRFLMTISNIFLGCYLLFDTHICNVPRIILLIPLIIMIYTGYKSYYPIKYEEDFADTDWIYNRTHNIIYWVMVMIQGYIYWIVLLKPQIFFQENEVLFDFLIKITRIYTIDEKIMYLYQYFEYYLQRTLIPIEEQDFIRYKLRLIDFKTIIDDTTMLKDIITNIKIFIQVEYYGQLLYVYEKIIALTTEPKHYFWYEPLKNTIIIAATMKTALYLHEWWIVFKQLGDPYQLYQIGRELTYKYPRLTMGSITRVMRFFEQLAQSRLHILDVIINYSISDISLLYKIASATIAFAFAGTFVLPPFVRYLESYFTDPVQDRLDEIPINIIESSYHYYFLGAFISLIILMHMLILYLKITTSSHHGKDT